MFFLLQFLFIFQTLHILSLSYAGHLYALLSVEIQEKDNITRTTTDGSYIKSKPNTPHFPIQHKFKKYIQRKSDKHYIGSLLKSLLHFASRHLLCLLAMTVKQPSYSAWELPGALNFSPFRSLLHLLCTTLSMCHQKWHMELHKRTRQIQKYRLSTKPAVTFLSLRYLHQLIGRSAARSLASIREESGTKWTSCFIQRCAQWAILLLWSPQRCRRIFQFKRWYTTWTWQVAQRKYTILIPSKWSPTGCSLSMSRLSVRSECREQAARSPASTLRSLHTRYLSLLIRRKYRKTKFTQHAKQRLSN